VLCPVAANLERTFGQGAFGDLGDDVPTLAASDHLALFWGADDHGWFLAVAFAVLCDGGKAVPPRMKLIFLGRGILQEAVAA
jgi:hypothetical protein